MKYDVAVIGAGLAGLSTAYHLAESGMRRIIVLEQETKLGGHASGRNAGMIRQSVEDAILAELAREGRDSLERASRSGWENIRFTANGSLFLDTKSPGELKKLKKISDKAGISSRLVSSEEAVKLHPALKHASFKQALYCPSDAVVDIGPLLSGFLSALKAVEVPVVMGASIRAIYRTNDRFLLETPKGVFEAGKIVNAAGAWAGLVGKKAGAAPMPLKAYRRHLFFTGQYASERIGSWPFVWDLGLGFYFRPVDHELLLSPCDHTWQKLSPSTETESRKELTDPKMEKVLLRKARNFSTYFSKLKISKPLSGLRTTAPDGRFVIGEDPKLKDFFWCAGLGGHGVTTCFSVGRLTRDLVAGQRVKAAVEKALSPRRFWKK